MGLQQTGTNVQQTRDAVSSKPTVSNAVKIKTDNLVITEGPIQLVSTNIGHGWIAGSANNGIVGAWTGTEDGSQLVVGSGTARGQNDTVQKVINNNNIFVEQFGFNNFESSPATTANWNTTSQQLSFGTTSIAQSLAIFQDAKNVNTAKMTITPASTASVLLQLSSASPISWETVTNNTLHTFTSVGQYLRFKITSSVATTLTEIKVEYNK